MIGASIAVSYISAISVSTIPGEVYKHGNVMMWKVFVLPFVILFVSWKLLPKFYDFGKVSTFEFVKDTFGEKVSLVALISMVFGTIFYMARDLNFN